MKTFLRFCVSFFSVSSLLLMPGRALASGGTDECEEMLCGDSFFAPEIVLRPDDAPLFGSGHTFYDTDGDIMPSRMAALDKLNVQEWKTFFEGKLSDEQLGNLLYKEPIAVIDELIFALKGKKAKPSSAAQGYFAPLQAVGNAKAVAALFYLGYAKRVEPFGTFRAEQGWASEGAEKRPTFDRDAADKLFRAGEAPQTSVALPFLRQRYAFQRLRLLFLGQRDAQAVQFFESERDHFDEGSIRYRFLELGAGTYAREKRYAEANYLFSQIFDRFAPLRRSAYLSFQPHEDADWKQALGFAKNTRERTVLWQLTGIKHDGITAIEEIHRADPASDLLPLLVVREVQSFESHLGNGNITRPDLERAGDDTFQKNLAALEKIAPDRKLYRPYVWQIALEHWHALLGDKTGAEQYRKLAEKQSPDNAIVRNQIRISWILARAKSLQKPDAAWADGFTEELRWLGRNDLPPESRAAPTLRWLRNHLSELYARKGDLVRATLLTTDENAYQKLDGATLVKQIAFLNSTPATKFDRFLKETYKVGTDELNAARAVNFLAAAKYADAAAAYRTAGKPGEEPLAADPFHLRLKECIECDVSGPSEAGTASYTRRSFAQKLADLAKVAGQPGHERETLAMAHALYYMTRFPQSLGLVNYGFPDESPEAPAMQRALELYQGVVTGKGTDEDKAEAAFLAVKLRPFLKMTDSYDGQPSVLRQKYYRLLKDQFSKTKYFAEIIEECGTFARYMGKEKSK